MPRLLEGTNVAAPVVARSKTTPVGYVFVPPGYGLMPGYVRRGPDHDMKTTVCLLSNDDGAWFRALVEAAGGVVEAREF